MQHEYQVIGLLGQGAFGKVYQVKDRNGNKYAKKQIPKKMFLRIPNLKDYYHSQINVMKSISSDYVVKFIKEQQKKDSHEIIMELCEEGNLSTYIKKYYQNKQIPQQTILTWFAQILLGMQALHNVNVIHRDLKLENIFVRKNGSVLIGDFGISKIADEGVLMSQIGTKLYLAPEVKQIQPYTSKVDIWALGIILYQLYNNLKFPFNSKFESMSQSSIKKAIIFISTPQQARYIIRRMLIADQNSRIGWLDIHNSKYLQQLIQMLIQYNQNNNSQKMLNDLMDCKQFYKKHQEILDNIKNIEKQVKILFYSVYQKWMEHYNDSISKTYQMMMFEFLLAKRIIQLYYQSEMLKKKATQIKISVMNQIELLQIKSTYQNLHFNINTIRLKNKKTILQQKQMQTINSKQYFQKMLTNMQERFCNSEWKEGEKVYSYIIQFI